MDAQSRMSNFPKNREARDSELPSRKNGDHNRSGTGFDEFSTSEMRDTHIWRQTIASKEKEEEFARCTIDSSSTHRSAGSDYDS